MIRIFGAGLLLAGCGGFGFLMGVQYRREMGLLKNLLSSLREMEWELKYRLTPLPELCGIAAAASGGRIGEVYLELKKALETGVCSEISGCMNGLLQTMEIPDRPAKCLKALGNSLGRYDLEGQLQGLQAVKAQCSGFLEELEDHRTERLRCYQTLGLCCGAALVILFI